MMGWQRPEVFWGIALAAIPVVIHLLRMHRANRVPFPSVRFVRPSHTAAVRLRIPSDWLLLALRIGIVALAVSAVAGPILLTQSRVSAWNAQVAYARRIDVVDLGAGVSRAAAWLESAPPARREIVVVSGFQRGAIDDTVIREIPAGIGIRLVQVRGAVQSAVVQGVELYGVDRIARRAQSIELTTDTTAVSISDVPGPAQGVRIIAHATARADVDALLKSIAIAGTPAGSPHQPIAIQLDDGGNPGTLASIHAGWMLQTVLRLREDLALARLMANTSSRRDRVFAPYRWRTSGVTSKRTSLPLAIRSIRRF